ncbi:MAG: hypothetical protein MZW92_66325 [Comamonadaceae bacterium]|nr:hypothetical protein [Comamonadaceae bacterium]
MLAKITAKNQLTLPKAVTNAVGPAEYFDVQARDGTDHPDAGAHSARRCSTRQAGRTRSQ